MHKPWPEHPIDRWIAGEARQNWRQNEDATRPMLALATPLSSAQAIRPVALRPHLSVGLPLSARFLYHASWIDFKTSQLAYTKDRGSECGAISVAFHRHGGSFLNRRRAPRLAGLGAPSRSVQQLDLENLSEADRRGTEAYVGNIEIAIGAEGHAGRKEEAVGDDDA
jgi:hypothetical protein